MPRIEDLHNPAIKRILKLEAAITEYLDFLGNSNKNKDFGKHLETIELFYKLMNRKVPDCIKEAIQGYREAHKK